MFGFGKTKEELKKEQKANDEYSMECYADAGMHGLFGTSNPKKINQQMRKYMPELMNTIKTTKEKAESIDDGVTLVTKNQTAMLNILTSKIDELKEMYEDEKRKNQELQEKYNALVERMAAYIERDGRGR